MKAIRRFYRYLVALISLEVILWGLINLARSTVAGETLGGGVDQLARSLSLILVGLPVFLLHWLPAQREARQDEDERNSRLRALFLYGALLATLIPLAQNTLALVDHLWLRGLGLPARDAFVGQTQSWMDNLIAILINGVAAGYIFSVERQNWKDLPEQEAFVQTRRLYRYIWVLYGLAMLVFGVSQVLEYVFTLVETIGTGPQAELANGLSLLIVGTPLWVFAWLRVQTSLDQAGERDALLRTVLLYALRLIGLGGILIPAGIILDTLLSVVLGQRLSRIEIVTEISPPLSAAIPLAGVWFYYRRNLQLDLTILPKSSQRDGLRRIYQYILVVMGLAATFLGGHMLLSYSIDGTLSDPELDTTLLRERLSAAISTLVVGAPLWGFVWFPLSAKVARQDESGDRSRRSTARKVCLYLILFAGVIGVMGSGGGLIYELLSALLGDPSANLLRKALKLSELLVLFGLLLGYHWHVLRTDLRLAERSLAERQAEFPVLVLASEIGDFTKTLVDALRREAETLPVAVHLVEHGVPGEDLAGAKAVLMSTELIASPPEAIRLWLQDFDGARLIIPAKAKGWHWVFGGGYDLSRRARQAAKMVRQLAEGEEPQQPGELTAGKIILYIFVSLLAIPFLFSLVAMLLSPGFD